PRKEVVATPNNLITTPFRASVHGSGVTPGRTPGMKSSREMTPGTTPLRDKLNINPEDHLGFEDVLSAQNYKAESRNILKEALSSLPAPRNDYEIVVPEDEQPPGEKEQAEAPEIMDQADVDHHMQLEQKALMEAEMKKQSTAVQRDLPRPSDVNSNILRPSHCDPPLTELQKAEELIKQEMLVMMHHDALKHPPQIPGAGKKPQQPRSNVAHHASYLERHPYLEYDEDDVQEASQLLKEEMEVVKKGMGHGDLSLEAYTQVWEECLAQVLFLPTQNRYTRANLASKKDRIESLEKRLEQNRNQMTKEAKRAAKIEKKLRILLGGYQSRNQALMKQHQDLVEQVEQTHLELNTFKALQELENLAITKRVESLTEDVNRQVERERMLQKKYEELLFKKTKLEGELEVATSKA
ncbi:Cell division cycle 5-like protein, partial [Araneus ventricosus]